MIKIDTIEEIGADIIAEITAPIYWWKQANNYKNIKIFQYQKENPIITKEILDKKFTLNDFSHEHLITTELDTESPRIVKMPVLFTLECTIDELNYCREKYLETQNEIWWLQIIQLLPMSYNKKMTVKISYEIINDAFEKRKKSEKISCSNEWNEFFNWIEEIPLYRTINEYIKIIENINEENV